MKHVQVAHQALLLCRFIGGSNSVLLPRFLAKIRSVRILDMIECLGHCFGCSISLMPGWQLQ